MLFIINIFALKEMFLKRQQYVWRYGFLSFIKLFKMENKLKKLNYWSVEFRIEIIQI